MSDVKFVKFVAYGICSIAAIWVFLISESVSAVVPFVVLVIAAELIARILNN